MIVTVTFSLPTLVICRVSGKSSVTTLPSKASPSNSSAPASAVPTATAALSSHAASWVER